MSAPEICNQKSRCFNQNISSVQTRFSRKKMKLSEIPNFFFRLINVPCEDKIRLCIPGQRPNCEQFSAGHIPAILFGIKHSAASNVGRMKTMWEQSTIMEFIDLRIRRQIMTSLHVGLEFYNCPTVSIHIFQSLYLHGYRVYPTTLYIITLSPLHIILYIYYNSFNLTIVSVYLYII